jgi:hypothetical protein
MFQINDRLDIFAITVGILIAVGLVVFLALKLSGNDGYGGRNYGEQVRYQCANHQGVKQIDGTANVVVCSDGYATEVW